MKYFSTNRKSPAVSFREAVLNGQPPDKGLYFPENIPQLSTEFLRSLPDLSQTATAFEVIRPFVGGDIDDEKLWNICAETVNFDFPLVKVTKNIFALELFHGATLAFKDVGARFMSRCLREFSRQKTVVVVATSGDTGGAVAAGFLGVENVEVVILYPSGKVSHVQELQLTTHGQNITALEVAGTFDDCQTLAKTALADEDLKKRVFVTSANSINVARWLPQQFYYFDAWQQWRDENSPIFSVPSGNFGNVCAGLLAHVSGLPVKHFIAACNANDVVPKFLNTGEMSSQPAVATLSNAMDVAAPSNFVRILELFGGDREKLKSKMSAVSVSDDATAATMREAYEIHDYILDPHGAVGFHALENYLKNGETGIFLATAHPIKFDSVEKIVGTFGETPKSVAELFSRPKQSIKMPVNYSDVKEILLSKI